MLRPGGILLVFASLLCAQTDRVRVWQDTVTFPTFKENPPAALPPFDQFALNGVGVRAIYPYTLRLNMTREKYAAPWRVLHLENQYLHCLVFPDLGGHLYTCRDKLSGADIFYANTAIKKFDVGPRGAWVAGGIENSFPVAHSRVTVSPVHFATAASADGSATVFVGATDRVSGMEWRVAYTLHPGSAVLEQKSAIYNPGSVRQPYQWWTNAAIRQPDSGLQFTYPMWVTAPHGPGGLEPWPVDTGGVDRSRSNNYADDLGVFAYGSSEPFFAEYNPQSRTGVAHWADPREVPGKKIWVWGKNNRAYKDNLSDDHSGYAEIQAGLATTQDMMQYLEPQESRTFTELWIPSRNTGGISRATPAAVLFMQRTAQADGTVKATFDLNVTSALPHATLTVTKDDTTVFQKSADLNPGTVFHAETEAVSPAGKFRFELKDGTGQVLLAHQEDTYDATVAGEVKIGAPMPVTIAKDALSQAEEDELARVLDRAGAEYDSALKAAPTSVAVRKAAGRFWVELHRLPEAVAILEPLQRENPSDAEMAYYLGVAKSELGDDAAARPLWESILTDTKLGMAAQDRLACSLARAGQQKTAAGRFHALAARGAGRAAGLEVALLRRMGQTADAQAALQKALAANPLDSLLRVEAVLLGRDDATIWAHLAADPEWVLDVAEEYMDAGLYQDAVAVLDRSYPAVGELETEPGAVLPQDYPLVAYYRGYARVRLGQSAAEDFRKAAGQSTLYVHPYRASSYPVLRAAVELNPADATAHYLLGCLLFNSRENDQALAEWNLAKPAAARIPGYSEILKRVRVNVSKTDRPANAGRVALADGGALPTGNFKSPVDAADSALGMLAGHNPEGAAAIFQNKNFPQDTQPPEVRQAYAEVWLQRLLVAARPGACQDVAARIDNFPPEDRSLPFTFQTFREIKKQLRIQFYFGLAEALCGDRKAAERRWSGVARAKVPASSAEFAFPVLAASLINPAGSQRTVETALETVRSGGGPVEKGLRLYVEGLVLRAAGRNEEANARFQEGSAESPAYIRYLNASAQNDPALPR